MGLAVADSRCPTIYINQYDLHLLTGKIDNGRTIGSYQLCDGDTPDVVAVGRPPAKSAPKPGAASPPTMPTEPPCAYRGSNGSCIYIRDAKGRLQFTPEQQARVCENYDKMMKSNAQVGAWAGTGAILGTVNAATGGAIKSLARVTAKLGGPIVTFFAGVTGAITGVLGFTSPPPGCH